MIVRNVCTFPLTSLWDSIPGMLFCGLAQGARALLDGGEGIVCGIAMWFNAVANQHNMIGWPHWRSRRIDGWMLRGLVLII